MLMEALTKQDGPESAALQKFDFSSSATGEALALDWEKKAIHSRQAGKGLAGGLTERGVGLVLSHSAATDLQIYDANGTQLAGINSGGEGMHIPNFELFFGRQASTRSRLCKGMHHSAAARLVSLCWSMLDRSSLTVFIGFDCADFIALHNYC